MDTIVKNMIINDVIKKYPRTLKIFKDYNVDSCCGGGATIEQTAARDGVDVDALIKVLNEFIKG